jgi:hypothetical protein
MSRSLPWTLQIASPFNLPSLLPADVVAVVAALARQAVTPSLVLDADQSAGLALAEGVSGVAAHPLAPRLLTPGPA